jgi:hypothetical protein
MKARSLVSRLELRKQSGGTRGAIARSGRTLSPQDFH